VIWSSISGASRHLSRCRTSSGILHRARRRWTCVTTSASVVVVSSQDFGRNSSQLIAADALSVTACTLTPIWQFPTFPNVPDYILATPGGIRSVFREAAVVDGVGIGLDELICHRATRFRTST
jgi:hypothetical protein